MNLPALLTVQEVARYLHVHPNTVKRLPIPYYRIRPGGDRRYRREDIEAYLEALRG